MPNLKTIASGQDDALARDIEQIAEIFARGVCRFWKRRLPSSGGRGPHISAENGVNRLDNTAEIRPCVHSKQNTERRKSQ